jgi:hypothetical protein
MTTQLEDLLDAVRDALVAGDFAALAQLGDNIDALADTPPEADRAAARRLRAKAERNARLLQAAARGVKAALGRLSDIASGPTLTTYDAQGRKTAVAPVALPVLRRF